MHTVRVLARPTDSESEDDDQDESPGWKAESDRINASVAEVVRAAYVARGYTQEDFAGTAGINYRTFQRLDAGRGWTIGYLARVARALGVDPTVILVRAGVSDTSLDVLSAVALDRTLTVQQREAITLLIRSIRYGQLPGVEQ